MLEKIRVLVVDDSAFMRKIISDMINSQPDMIAVDTARDGKTAIDKVKTLKPDIVTLDVEMPQKNGLEALKEIRALGNYQVIMLSSLTAEGSSITIDALGIGAFDFIQKPSGSISLDIGKVKEELIEKIRHAKKHQEKLGKLNQVGLKGIGSYNPLEQFNSSFKVDALVLGASTGGPRVLFDIISKFPGDLNIPVFVVQHMPSGFTRVFAERINKASSLAVVEAGDGEYIKPNTVYIAPGGYHMLISGKRIKLDNSPTLHGVRPAVDKLFISASITYGGNTLACIFTGMGKDGAEGAKAIKGKGGRVIVQDETTCTVYGMPKAAVETGCVDLILPDYKIEEELVKAIKRM